MSWGSLWKSWMQETGYFPCTMWMLMVKLIWTAECDVGVAWAHSDTGTSQDAMPPGTGRVLGVWKAERPGTAAHYS